MAKRGPKFGHIVTEETREKLRVKNLGKQSPFKGKKHSEEVKKIIRERRAAQVFTKEQNMKRASNWTGDKHWNWQGGVSSENHRVRNSVLYKEWRKSVFLRDNFTCVICFKFSGKLNADHIKSFSEYKELRFDLNNGRTLCVECHKQTPNYGWKAKALLGVG